MPVRVGILGATGAVGQRFIQLLDGHSTFELAAVTASESSAGKTYREAAKWRVNTPIPDDVATMTVEETDPSAVPDDVDLLFSSLPSGVAAEIEPAFLEAGYVVSSNSSNDRMAADVPLTIPEINPGHLDLIEVQRDERGWDGALVKNPNCSTITMVPTLAALDEFGLESIQVSTLQAVSGAGYSGVTSMEIIDNAIPHIGGEEAKMETESRKLLGEFDGTGVELHGMDVAASCNRIPTLDGHLENVFAETAVDASPEDAAEAMREYSSIDLPSSPDQLIHVFEDFERPQPRRRNADLRGWAPGDHGRPEVQLPRTQHDSWRRRRVAAQRRTPGRRGLGVGQAVQDRRGFIRPQFRSARPRTDTDYCSQLPVIADPVSSNDR